jgi:hypothetical protein
MTKIASVAEVQHAGVTIAPEEAVAIAQQLIDALRTAHRSPTAQPPYGPPTTSNVYLSEDGSVLCCGCETTPAVSEIAIFLQAMLPVSGPVPGGLRYAVARALLDVDVQPFDSLDDFAEMLTRYERGSRAQLVRQLLARFETKRALVPRAMADRRRHPRTTHLRRELREADARLYLQKVATDAVMLTVTSRAQARPRSLRGAALCVAAGLVLIVAGEFIDGWHHPAAPAPIVVQAPAPPVPIERSTPDRGAASATVRTSNIDERSGSIEPQASESRPVPSERRVRGSKRPVRTAPARPARSTTRKTTAAASRGVLDRLRLGWLRNALSSL